MKLSLKTKETKIQTIFIDWYKNNKRNLPWRKLLRNNLPNPYYVFVSEYMLQQTKVSTVKTRFEEFINKWPTLKALSKTSEPRILKFWSGLGYYSRARNLLKAAKIINNEFNSIIPNKYEDLIMLPGIGDYTAKAIMGIGYNQSVMPLDANIERIISRLYAFKEPLVKIKKKLSDHSQFFLSKKKSSILIQSFMDYGSIICTPRSPNCSICQVQKYCLEKEKKIQNEIPKKIKKLKIKPIKYSCAYVLINEKKEVLVRKRSPRGMLASMLEVPNDPWVEKKNLLKKDELFKKIINRVNNRGSLTYSFSHFDLHTDIFYSYIKKDSIKKGKWLKISNYTKSQLPTVMKKIVKLALINDE